MTGLLESSQRTIINGMKTQLSMNLLRLLEVSSSGWHAQRNLNTGICIATRFLILFAQKENLHYLLAIWDLWCATEQFWECPEDGSGVYTHSISLPSSLHTTIVRQSLSSSDWSSLRGINYIISVPLFSHQLNRYNTCLPLRGTGRLNSWVFIKHFETPGWNGLRYQHDGHGKVTRNFRSAKSHQRTVRC